MNEVLTVLIGTLSGFIIAFFAEPVKTYYQNMEKVHNLRVALYKELFLNYVSLEAWVLDEEKLESKAKTKTRGKTKAKTESGNYRTEEYVAQYALRTDCYKHALQNDLTLFYQLPEALAISILQGNLIGQIMGISRDLRNWMGEEGMKDSGSRYMQLSSLFRESYLDFFNKGTFDKKILKRLVNEKEYQKIIQQGKEMLEKDEAETNP